MTQRVLPSGGMPDSSAMRWTGRGGTRRTRRKPTLFFTRSDRGKKSSSPPTQLSSSRARAAESRATRAGPAGRSTPRTVSLPPPAGGGREPAHVALRPRPLPGRPPDPPGPSPPPPCRSFSPDGTPVPGISGVWRPPARSHNIPAGSWRGTTSTRLSDSSSAPQSPSDRARSPAKTDSKGAGPVCSSCSAARSPHRPRS